MNPTMQMRVEALQTNIRRPDLQPMLHILNGQAMAEQFAANGLMAANDVYAPFNEAMCANDACEGIFSDAFIRLRAAGHGVTEQDYTRTVLEPLKPLFERAGSQASIVLWFGDDMFCQMNMLTLLAYLKESRIDAQIRFHQVNEESGEIEAVELPDADYEGIYRQVLVLRERPATSVIPALQRGIELYLAYGQPENEITAFIREHAELPQRELLGRLFRRFPHYGLGDSQYAAIIDRVVRG